VTKAVFFDAGHTLLYAHPDLGTVYSEMTSSLGVHLSPDQFTEVFIPVFKETTRIYAQTSAASDAQDHAMWRDITRRIYDRLPTLAGVEFDAWFEALYDRFGDPAVWKFYDDVEPALMDLRARGIKIGIISNWDSRLKRISDGLGLTRLVDFLVISAEAGIRKPDPRIFRIALERAGVLPEEAIHVGDLPEEDAEGARRAGVRPILIDRKRRLTAQGFPAEVRVLTSLADLPSLL
jgi:putative hydrolase of the HAD superfamily